MPQFQSNLLRFFSRRDRAQDPADEVAPPQPAAPVAPAAAAPAAAAPAAAAPAAAVDADVVDEPEADDEDEEEPALVDENNGEIFYYLRLTYLCLN